MTKIKLNALVFFVAILLTGCSDQNVTVTSGGGNSEQSQETEKLPVEEPVEE
jgi:PBP1b-binding outer membrane lipoprotein LpoB